jgi:TPR repeat protein
MALYSQAIDAVTVGRWDEALHAIETLRTLPMLRWGALLGDDGDAPAATPPATCASIAQGCSRSDSEAASAAGTGITVGAAESAPASSADAAWPGGQPILRPPVHDPSTEERAAPRPGSLSADTVAVLFARANALRAAGDILLARLYYARAAQEGHARAAFMLGESYDPALHARAGDVGATGDATKAFWWYRRARELGDQEAERRLQSLIAAGASGQK